MNLQIRNLEEHHGDDHIWWSADVISGGQRVHVDNYFGSWQTAKAHGLRHDVLPDVAKALQARLPSRFRKVKPPTPKVEA